MEPHNAAHNADPSGFTRFAFLAEQVLSEGGRLKDALETLDNNKVWRMCGECVENVWRVITHSFDRPGLGSGPPKHFHT